MPDGKQAPPGAKEAPGFSLLPRIQTLVYAFHRISCIASETRARVVRPPSDRSLGFFLQPCQARPCSNSRRGNRVRSILFIIVSDSRDSVPR